MSELGACPRCGEPLRHRIESYDGIPDCANECRQRFRREYDAARHATIVQEMRSIMAVHAADTEAAGQRRRGWSLSRARG